MKLIRLALLPLLILLVIIGLVGYQSAHRHQHAFYRAFREAVADCQADRVALDSLRAIDAADMCTAAEDIAYMEQYCLGCLTNEDWCVRGIAIHVLYTRFALSTVALKRLEEICEDPPPGANAEDFRILLDARK